MRWEGEDRLKEYHADGWVYGLPLYLMAPFAFLADYCSDVFPWAYPAFFVLLGASCLFYLVTPYKYFPLFTTLCIEEEWIKKRLFDTYTTSRVRRGDVNIGYVVLHGIRYIVFCKEEIPDDKREILRLVHRRKAFLFPWRFEMKRDFPELFDDNGKRESFYIS